MRTLASFSIVLLLVLLGGRFAYAEQRQLLPIATENYPPYEMEKPINGLRGFDYEVAKAVFELLAYETEVEFLPWKRALAYAKLGQVVGILTCAYREEREQFILFSDPISSLVNGFYVRKGFEGPKPVVLEDIKGQKVGSIAAYESFKALEAIDANPVAAMDSRSAIEMLKRERFDYLYVNQQSTDFLLKEMGLADSFDFYPISKQGFYFCFSKQFEGYRTIADEFNKALYILKKNGTYD